MSYGGVLVFMASAIALVLKITVLTVFSYLWYMLVRDFVYPSVLEMWDVAAVEIWRVAIVIMPELDEIVKRRLCGFGIGYEYLVNEDISIETRLYMYAACVCCCAGLLYAPYVTLIQLAVLAVCLLIVEEHQKKDEETRIHISWRNLSLACALLGVCCFVSAYAPLFLVCMLAMFAYVDYKYCDKAYGAIFWCSMLVFCLSVIWRQDLALLMIFFQISRIIVKAFKIDEKLEPQINKLKKKTRKRMRKPTENLQHVMKRFKALVHSQLVQLKNDLLNRKPQVDVET